MLQLKLQYFGHLMRRADSLEKTLMHQGPGGQRHAALCPHGGPGGQGQPQAAAEDTGQGHRGGRMPGAEVGAAQHLHQGLGVAGGGLGPGPAILQTNSDGSDALGVGDGKWRSWNSWAGRQM